MENSSVHLQIKNVPQMLVNGVICTQQPEAFDVFGKVVQDFDNIVEIGTHHGGFSLWLHLTKKPSTNFYTFEVDSGVIQIPSEYGVNVVLADCFSPQGIQLIQQVITSDGKTLVLCDGGNKIHEFQFFSRFLKSGDVIMAHDYSTDQVQFDRDMKSKGWIKPEICFSDIEDSVRSNGLDKFMYDEFCSVFWGSFIKT